MLRRVGRFLQTVGREGPARAVRLALHRAESARWERSLGVETAGDHRLDSEGLGGPDHHDHSPSSVPDLRRALRLVRGAPERHVFLDFGAGRGRAALMAATLPFRRVIGVELSPRLVEVARRNLERARPHLRCREVEFVEASADRYAIPPDVTIAYFYNPFGGEVLARVIENLRGSLLAAPRPLAILFATPERFERAITGAPWIRARAEFTGLRRHILYECAPPG